MRRSKFLEYRFVPLADKDIEAFVNQRQAAFKQLEADTERRKTAAQFLRQVHIAAIDRLLRNPLLLTLALTIYLDRTRLDLPRSLSALYSEAIKNLINRRSFTSAGRPGRLDNLFAEDHILPLLRSFALFTKRRSGQDGRGSEEFSKRELIEFARQLAPSPLDIRTEQAEILVDDSVNRTGLLVTVRHTPNAEILIFAHRSIQEYFAGRSALVGPGQSRTGFGLCRRHILVTGVNILRVHRRASCTSICEHARSSDRQGAEPLGH